MSIELKASDLLERIMSARHKAIVAGYEPIAIKMSEEAQVLLKATPKPLFTDMEDLIPTVFGLPVITSKDADFELVTVPTSNPGMARALAWAERNTS